MRLPSTLWKGVGEAQLIKDKETRNMQDLKNFLESIEHIKRVGVFSLDDNIVLGDTCFFSPVYYELFATWA